jgi:hypothetical protein
MKEWQHYTTCSIHLDHEQLLLLKGRPGSACVKLIYRGAILTPEGEACERGSQVGAVGASSARTGFIAFMGRRFVAWTAPLRIDGLQSILAAIRRRLPILERT